MANARLNALIAADPANAVRYRKMSAAQRAALLKKQPVNPVAPMTQAQIQQLAATLAGNKVQPELDALTQIRQRSQSEAAAMRKAQIESGKYLADALAGIAPQVQGIFGSGAALQGSLAQGLGQDEAAAAAGTADEFTQLLQANNAPQGSIDSMRGAVAPPGLSELTYGMGGYLPGETMQDFGSAFGALAALQPGFAAGRAQLAANQTDDELLTSLGELDDQELQIRARIGPEKEQAYFQLLENELAKYAARQADQQIADSATADAMDYDIDQRKIQMDLDEAAEDARLKGKQLDVPASRALGYAVYKDGSSNKNIKVPKYGSGSSGSKRAERRAEARVDAERAVEDLWDEGQAEYEEVDPTDAELLVNPDAQTKRVLKTPAWQFWKWKAEVKSRVYETLKAAGFSDKEINDWIEKKLRQRGIKRKPKPGQAVSGQTNPGSYTG